MAQYLRTLAVIAQDPGLSPRTHVITPVQEDLMPTSGFLGYCTHMAQKRTFKYTHRKSTF